MQHVTNRSPFGEYANELIDLLNYLNEIVSQVFSISKTRINPVSKPVANTGKSG